MTALYAQWLDISSSAPSGEPHPVLVLPGFGASDHSTQILRRFLKQLGYNALPWLQGVNTGNPHLIEGAMRRFYRLQRNLGCRISLVGQSLGGVYAREIAKLFPHAVRSVITLGSPYAMTESGATHPMVERFFEQLSGTTFKALRDRIPTQHEPGPLLMPTTSVYSKADGVVGWRSCVEPETPLSENVRVWGSHVGMAINPDVFRVVADRLAQNPDHWTRFDTNKGRLKLIYPPKDHVSTTGAQ
jgi:pimeloyl-ACP methyl ester carboxylesterase